MFLWNKRIKYYKFLTSLGFFKNIGFYEQVGYKKFLWIKQHNYSLNYLNILNYGLFYIIPLLVTIQIKKNCFLFIDLNKTNFFFFNKLYKLFKYTLSFLIYDWTYGLITNFFVIELNSYDYRSNNLPVLVFLLALFEQRSIIYNELNRKNLLSIGLVSLEEINYVDYPIFIKPKIEYSFIFFQLILKLLNVKT